jgi:hypothetical protein
MAQKIIRKGTMVAAAGLGAYVLFFRPWQRRWGATDEEVKRMLPGDELVPHADVVETRVVTVNATPAAIWPWLVQIGQGKAGYYSYERLENLAGLKMKNAEGINPDWQHLQVGDIVPAEPGGKGFKVVALEHGRALVLGGREGDTGVFEGFTHMFPEFSWAFVIAPLDSEHTRLISRFRSLSRPSFWNRLTSIFFEPIEFLMTSRMLLGIKKRAEQANELTGKPDTSPGRKAAESERTSNILNSGSLAQVARVRPIRRGRTPSGSTRN